MNSSYFVPWGLLVWVGLGATAVAAIEPADTQRLDAVAERGHQVMPFDLDKTTHIFTQTETGGQQRVIAKNSTDVEQIQLIQKHLAQIAAAFAQGDFSGPARIHGETMPGLAILRAAQPGSITYRYEALPNGAQLDYTSTEAGLIEAIHRYFEAQLSDHARHAMPGHALHPKSPQ